MPTRSEFKEGDRVQIVDREATADDVKSGLFYNYFRNLTGIVQKVYPTQEVAVEIETTSLDAPVEQRHTDVQEQMRTKWLDGLSEAERGRLSEQEKDFRLRYTVLLSMQDLTAPTRKAVADAPRVPAIPAAEDTTPPRRATMEELEAAEEAELQRRAH